jgi:hypothetical protein
MRMAAGVAERPDRPRPRGISTERCYLRSSVNDFLSGGLPRISFGVEGLGPEWRSGEQAEPLSRRDCLDTIARA